MSHSKLIILLTAVVLLLSCSRGAKQCAVPYTDDYTSLAGISRYKDWNAYNVHDPSCKKFGDYYYLYSTDAYFGNPMWEAKKMGIKTGNIPYRRSKDLVQWEFLGWAFDSIPQVAVDHVRAHNNGRGATNIWAPYLMKYKDIYRLYYCVSAFATNVSYLGLAESDSPEGPWRQKGCVVATTRQDKMNAIDPSVITDAQTGEQWLHYGSYFDGLYCVQLDPETGFVLNEGDKGHAVVRRYHLSKDNVEAPEIIYNPQNGFYYLFVSYDPLMTTYNIRVGRSRYPQGPFYDYYGNDMAEYVNDFPILTYSYRFENHPGWAGLGHCSVTDDEQGRFYVFHQGRLSPENHLMDLHIRQIFWTSDEWPVFSPERYAGVGQRKIRQRELVGTWEIICIKESPYRRGTEAGQVLRGENRLVKEETCLSKEYRFNKDGSISNILGGKWQMNGERLSLQLNGISSGDLSLHRGLDWENGGECILFTGLDNEGNSLWGKKIR